MPLPKNQINQAITNYFSFIASGLVIVLSISFLQFFLIPQYRMLQQSGIIQYHNLQQLVTERRRFLTDLQAMQQAYDEFDFRALRYVDTVLPADYDLVDAFAEIDDIFEGTNFIVQSINVSEATAATAGEAVTDTTDTPTTTPVSVLEYQVVQISVNVSVRNDSLNYADFKTILQRIEQHQHVLNLDQLVYAPNANGFTLILKTYQRADAT